MASDEELMGRLVSGEKEALSELMKRYRQKGLSFAYRYLGNMDEAEDAAQDSFVKVYTHCRQFDKSRPFAGWYYGILANLCRDRLRQKKRFFLFTQKYEIQPEPTVTADENEKSTRSQQFLQTALQKLSPDKREILTLRLSQEMSYEQIGQTLGISAGTVMSRLFRAKKELERILKEMGVLG